MMMTEHDTRGLKTPRLKIGVAVLIVAALAGCGGADVEYNYPRSGAGGKPTYEKKESIFGGRCDQTVCGPRCSSSNGRPTGVGPMPGPMTNLTAN
jgi:hypothetical protein